MGIAASFRNVLLGAISAAARGESYGELGHFGAAGTGPGQFQIPAGKGETHARESDRLGGHRGRPEPRCFEDASPVSMRAP